jgi:hypothetical protein
MAKRFVRLMGLALLALMWLPSSFLGRHEANAFSSGNEIRERVSVEAAFVIPSPMQQAQFHQFRLSGGQNWFTKKSGIDFIGTGRSSWRRNSEASTIPLPPPGANDLLKTWQFTCRTALPPRAPCQV